MTIRIVFEKPINVKFTLEQSTKTHRSSRDILLHILHTLALDGVWWLTPVPDHFNSWKDPVPIVQEAGWAPGPVWTGAENLAPTGFRSPDRPARSESLHRLSYPGPALNLTYLPSQQIQRRHYLARYDISVSSSLF